MKQIILSIILMFSGIMLFGSTILGTYTKLQGNPGYRKMSLLEIAIDRGDFEAIQYFEFRAKPAELKRARVLLQNKIATFDAIIRENKEEFLSVGEKVTSLERIEATRRSKGEYESLLREFNRKLEMIDKSDAARATAEEEQDAATRSYAAPAA